MNNLPADIVMALLVLSGGLLGLRALARRLGVSTLPLHVSFPAFVAAGLIFFLPISPAYIPSDGEFYQRWAESLAASWRGEGDALDRQIWPGKGFWPLIIAVFTFLAGPITISIIALNSLFLGATLVLTQKSTQVLVGVQPKWTAIILMLSSAPIVIFGPSLLRESIFWLGVSGGVLAIAYARPRQFRLSIVNFAWSSVLLLAIRPDAGFVFALSFAGVLVVLYGIVYSRRDARSVIAALGLLAIMASSAPFAFSTLREDTDVDTVAAVTRALSGSGVSSAFTDQQHSQTPSPAPDAGGALETFCSSTLVIRVGCGALENLPRVFFGPFPWEYQASLVWVASGLATMHFLLVIACSAIYLVGQGGRVWANWGLVLVSGVTLMMFAAILTNYGILMRFRVGSELVLFPLAFAGLEAARARLRAKLARSRTPDEETHSQFSGKLPEGN